MKKKKKISSALDKWQSLSTATPKERANNKCIHICYLWDVKKDTGSSSLLIWLMVKHCSPCLFGWHFTDWQIKDTVSGWKSLVFGIWFMSFFFFCFVLDLAEEPLEWIHWILAPCTHHSECFAIIHDILTNVLRHNKWRKTQFLPHCIGKKQKS